jgi:heat shock protein HslJ
MTRSLSLLLLSLSLGACAQAPSPPGSPAQTPSEPGSAMKKTSDKQRLGGYHWRLLDATDAQGRRIDALLIRPDQPIQFDFADDRIAVHNACNGIGGDVRIDGDTMRFAQLVSTKMACVDPAVMALDSEVSTRLQGKVRFAVADGDPPQLMWTAANGDTLRFVGAPTPETRFGSPGETVFLEVAAKTRPCQPPMMPSPQRCLDVRERRYDAQGQPIGAPGEWRPFHDTIEGYAHQEGIRQVLRVKRFRIAEPPTDSPAVAYVLEVSIESEMIAP